MKITKIALFIFNALIITFLTIMFIVQVLVVLGIVNLGEKAVFQDLFVTIVISVFGFLSLVLNSVVLLLAKWIIIIQKNYKALKIKIKNYNVIIAAILIISISLTVILGC